MALHESQNPYYCKHCNDMNPRYTLDFRCEKCFNVVWTKHPEHYQQEEEDEYDSK